MLGEEDIIVKPSENRRFNDATAMMSQMSLGGDFGSSYDPYAGKYEKVSSYKPKEKTFQEINSGSKVNYSQNWTGLTTQQMGINYNEYYADDKAKYYEKMSSQEEYYKPNIQQRINPFGEAAYNQYQMQPQANYEQYYQPQVSQYNAYQPTYQQPFPVDYSQQLEYQGSRSNNFQYQDQYQNQMYALKMQQAQQPYRYPQGYQMNDPYAGYSQSYFNPYQAQRDIPSKRSNMKNNQMDGFDDKRGYNNSMEMSRDKSGEYSLPSIQELILHLFEYCKDHTGSRIVQKKYEEASETEKAMIFEKIEPEIFNLSTDVFGNYVIQKLLEYSDKDKKKSIMSQLESRIEQLTLHMYGCRVIQKAIEYSDQEEVQTIMGELKSSIKKCIEDQNGNHVIQKLIEKSTPEDFANILSVVEGRVLS